VRPISRKGKRVPDVLRHTTPDPHRGGHFAAGAGAAGDSDETPISPASAVVVGQRCLMPRIFGDVAQLAAYLDSGEPLDPETTRAALVALVHRANTDEARLHALRAELDALKAAELNTIRARAAAMPPKGD
jgi:hypothetical protein